MDTKRGRLLQAAMQGVRLYGMDGLRIQHIGAMAGTVTSNIYAHFGGKDDLLRVCFEQVDREIAAIFDRERTTPQAVAADAEGEIRRLWAAYFHWLVAHPDETVFYHRYRDSTAFLEYDKQRDVSYFASFIATVRIFEDAYHIHDRITPDLLWLHLLNVTVLYAKNVVEGALPPGPETEESVFQLTMNGLRGLLGGEDQTKEVEIQ